MNLNSTQKEGIRKIKRAKTENVQRKEGRRGRGKEDRRILNGTIHACMRCKTKQDNKCQKRKYLQIKAHLQRATKTYELYKTCNETKHTNKPRNIQSICMQ